MKLLKLAGLAAIAALGLMAFAGSGSASATTLTCTDPIFHSKVTCPSGTEIDATAESSLIFKAGFANVTCTESTIKGTTSNAGSSTETVKANVNTLTFGNCNATVTVTKGGSLEIHTQSAGANNNGTLTSSGIELHMTVSPFTCTYGTNSTDLGILTGSSTTGKTSTVDISAELVKLPPSGPLCASPARWEGSYWITSPDWLDVD
jgi:hypothetical protein